MAIDTVEFLQRLVASNATLARTNSELIRKMEATRVRGQGHLSHTTRYQSPDDAQWDELARKWSEYNLLSSHLRECICQLDARELDIEKQRLALEQAPPKPTTPLHSPHSSVHKPRLDELLRTFRAIPKDRKSNSLSAKESKSMRYLLNKYQKYTEKVCLKGDCFEKLELHTWYGDSGDVRMYYSDVSAFVDETAALHTSRFDVTFFHGQEHAAVLDDLVRFFMPQLIGVRDALEHYILRDVSNTIVVRDGGKIVAANVFYVGATVHDVPIFDVQLFACAPCCSTMKLPQREWASHVLLKAMSLLCVRPAFHIVAQSIGYNYLLAKTDADDGVQHVTIQEENSKGRIFWAKHLQRDFASVILGAQMLCTDDASVHGDCTFMHFECTKSPVSQSTSA